MLNCEKKSLSKDVQTILKMISVFEADLNIGSLRGAYSDRVGLAALNARLSVKPGAGAAGAWAVAGSLGARKRDR